MNTPPLELAGPVRVPVGEGPERRPHEVAEPVVFGFVGADPPDADIVLPTRRRGPTEAVAERLRSRGAQRDPSTRYPSAINRGR